MSLGVYLGRPEMSAPFGMTLIPTPEPGGSSGGSGVNTVTSRATVTNSLLSGGVATVRKRNVKRSYSIAWSILIPSEIDMLMSFYDGRQGPGPYCLVDPSWSNHFPANVASMGAVLNSVGEWAPTVGALATSTQVGPTGLLTGVAGWTGAGNGSILYAGLNNVVDAKWLPPVISGISIRTGIYAKMLSGSATLTAAMMYGVGGSAPAGTAATGTGVVLSSSWQEVAVGVASSFSWAGTADYAMPKFTVSSSSSPSILLAAASFVYADTLNASSLSPWVSGLGVPRVLITGEVPTPVNLVGYRDWTLSLQES